MEEAAGCFGSRHYELGLSSAPITLSLRATTSSVLMVFLAAPDGGNIDVDIWSLPVSILREAVEWVEERRDVGIWRA